eukprot:6178748-Pleurochrysis_carterae.AAC.2
MSVRLTGSSMSAVIRSNARTHPIVSGGGAYCSHKMPCCGGKMPPASSSTTASMHDSASGRERKRRSDFSPSTRHAACVESERSCVDCRRP